MRSNVTSATRKPSLSNHSIVMQVDLIYNGDGDENEEVSCGFVLD